MGALNRSHIGLAISTVRHFSQCLLGLFTWTSDDSIALCSPGNLNMKLSRIVCALICFPLALFAVLMSFDNPVDVHPALSWVIRIFILALPFICVIYPQQINHLIGWIVLSLLALFVYCLIQFWIIKSQSSRSGENSERIEQKMSSTTKQTKEAKQGRIKHKHI